MGMRGYRFDKRVTDKLEDIILDMHGADSIDLKTEIRDIGNDESAKLITVSTPEGECVTIGIIVDTHHPHQVKTRMVCTLEPFPPMRCSRLYYRLDHILKTLERSSPID
ncbi:hypothetical protein Pla110_42450 [Polystyrenella longa]|uniref:Uncharacterized protein n=1 Tax=Polystyrenella longa TaxID=2528007 RepID=A0A518CTD4_9PLAN|nr:hypothetical protein Pla110_42450 [Polystyrenella longa]